MELKNIAVSLDCGKILNIKSLLLLCFIAILSLIEFLGVGVVAIFYHFGKLYLNIDTILALIIVSIESLLLFSIFLYLIIKNVKINKKILSWKDDLIELSAFSQKIDEYRLGMQPKASKIKVKFNYNNQVIQKESSFQSFGGKKGYGNIFNKYANRDIQILYSPKYDQVLILKDKKPTKKT